MTRPLLLLLAVALAWMPVRLAAAQDPPPQFRTGVTVTRLDVTVLDRQTRKPVTGLTPDDFVVKVDGTIQPIVSLAEIAVPGAGTVTAPAFVEAAEEVTRNEVESPRAFVLIMNDARGGIDPFYRKNGKDIAHRFIDLLGPEDLAAVIFVQRNQHAQDLTRDRTLLRRAIDQFDPTHVEALCPLHVVLRTQQFLRSMTAYRPAVVFVSATPPGRRIECAVRPEPPWELLDIAHAARFADVPVLRSAPRACTRRPGSSWLKGDPSST